MSSLSPDGTVNGEYPQSWRGGPQGSGGEISTEKKSARRCRLPLLHGSRKIADFHGLVAELNGKDRLVAEQRLSRECLVGRGMATHYQWWRTNPDSVSRADSVLFRSLAVLAVKHGDTCVALSVHLWDSRLGARNRTELPLHWRR